MILAAILIALVVAVALVVLRLFPWKASPIHRGGSGEGTKCSRSPTWKTTSFMKLQELYAAELPICGVCTLEDARQLLSWLVFEAPKDKTSERVRQALEGLLFVVTIALVSNRTEAEAEAEAEAEEGPAN